MDMRALRTRIGSIDRTCRRIRSKLDGVRRALGNGADDVKLDLASMYNEMLDMERSAADVTDMLDRLELHIDTDTEEYRRRVQAEIAESERNYAGLEKSLDRMEYRLDSLARKHGFDTGSFI